MRTYEGSYGYVRRRIGHDLANHSKEVRTRTWHAVDVSDSPLHVAHELRDVSLSIPMPGGQGDAEQVINPQMPWAEEHFQERVSGEPLNPPPSASKWLKPGAVDRHLKDFGGEVAQYSHTYPERFWPREAGRFLSDEGLVMPGDIPEEVSAHGIRFRYGDLNDVVSLMIRDPLTRQAYLPVWFPEDTGAHHGERVPCTLGYHFMVRERTSLPLLHLTYMIRSVDFVRHFHDDVYLAVRLAQWMRDQLNKCKVTERSIGVGNLTMHVMSMHAFEGDMEKLRGEFGV